MPKAYSDDLRKRVFDALDEGERPCRIATRLRVSPSWITKLKHQREETGSCAPPPWHPGRKAILAPHANAVREIVNSQKDATLEEIRGLLPVRVAIGTLHAALKRLGLSLKKSHPRRRAATP